MESTTGSGLRAFVAIAIALLARPAMPQDETPRPNVLVLLSDDQRTDAVSAWGNPYVETPHLDDLVRRAGLNEGTANRLAEAGTLAGFHAGRRAAHENRQHPRPRR